MYKVRSNIDQEHYVFKKIDLMSNTSQKILMIHNEV